MPQGVDVRIEIVLFDGFDELDVFGPFEVLSTPGIDVALVTYDQPRVVTSQRGVELRIGQTLGRPDGIVVPGGGWLSRGPRGAWAEAERGDLAAALVARQDDAEWIASVCSGAMLLAVAGLLEGRDATTNRAVFDELRPHVRAVLPERVVDAGDRITAGGLTAGLDLGLALIDRILGPEAAAERAAGIEYVPQGRVHRTGTTSS